jgi:hypothetical protein
MTTLTRYHAVMLDETGCEFGADVTTTSRTKAYEVLKELYPESRLLQLESPANVRRREDRLYQETLGAYDDQW